MCTRLSVGPGRGGATSDCVGRAQQLARPNFGVNHNFQLAEHNAAAVFEEIQRSLNDPDLTVESGALTRHTPETNLGADGDALQPFLE